MRFIGETRRTIITVESSFLLRRPAFLLLRGSSRDEKCRRGEGRGMRALIPREKTPLPPLLLDKCPRTICLQRNCCASFCSMRQTPASPPCSLLGSTLFLCGLYGDSVSFCQPRKCLFLLPFSYCVSQFGRFVFPLSRLFANGLLTTACNAVII